MEFFVIEVVKILRILNRYPTRNRREMVMIDELATPMELTDEERLAVAWRDTPTEDGAAIRSTWTSGATVTRELTKQQRKRMLVYVENPPQGEEWSRASLQLYNSIVAKLGGEQIGGDDDSE